MYALLKYTRLTSLMALRYLISSSNIDGNISSRRVSRDNTSSSDGGTHCSQTAPIHPGAACMAAVVCFWHAAAFKIAGRKDCIQRKTSIAQRDGAASVGRDGGSPTRRPAREKMPAINGRRCLEKTERGKTVCWLALPCRWLC